MTILRLQNSSFERGVSRWHHFQILKKFWNHKYIYIYIWRRIIYSKILGKITCILKFEDSTISYYWLCDWVITVWWDILSPSCGNKYRNNKYRVIISDIPLERLNMLLHKKNHFTICVFCNMDFEIYVGLDKPIRNICSFIKSIIHWIGFSNLCRVG